MREAYAFVLAHEADIEVCAVCGSAEEALGAFDGAAGDLVVADVRLPGMDGVEMMERLRTRWPDLVALVVSAYEEDVYVHRAREAGAYAFLSKRDLAVTLPIAILEALGDGHGDGVAGDLSARLPAEFGPPDELTELAETFNGLLAPQIAPGERLNARHVAGPHEPCTPMMMVTPIPPCHT